MSLSEDNGGESNCVCVAVWTAPLKRDLKESSHSTTFPPLFSTTVDEMWPCQTGCPSPSFRAFFPLATHFRFSLRNADLAKKLNDGLACLMCFIWNAANSTSALSVSGNNSHTSQTYVIYSIYLWHCVCITYVCLFVFSPAVQCNWVLLLAYFTKVQLWGTLLSISILCYLKEILYFLHHIFYLTTSVTSYISNWLQCLHPKENKWSHISPKILERRPKY